MRVERGHLGVARERLRAGQALVDDAPERIDVDPCVDRQVLDLLRRDVADAADELSRSRQGARGLLAVLGQAEVGQVGVIASRLRPRGEEDVPGLHVAMDQAGGMGGVEGARDLVDQGHGPVDGQRTLARDRSFEILARHVAHGDEQLAIGLARLVDRQDVRMVERRRQPRLADEPLADRRDVRGVRPQDLERDMAPEPKVVGEIDRAHPAPTDEPDDPVRAEDVALPHRHRPTIGGATRRG